MQFAWVVNSTAQVQGDICSNPLQIDTILNYCSPEGFFNLGDFTNSNAERPSCYPEDSNERDVWFKFTSNFANINIICRGDVGLNKGGTLTNPQITLYKGECDALTAIGCNSDARGLNVVELTIGDLELGEDYYLRVGSRSNSTGTFQLCVSNFPFTPEYDSDCPTATILCDKSTLIVNQLSGTGDIRDEADNSCLDINPTTNGDDGNSETSSVWFKWVARNNGDLTFVLDPNNPTDDLDFALYELTNGINDCSDKMILRCMASGEVVGAEFSVWEPCTGPTGLKEGSTDDLEWRGCDNGDDNFLAPLQMETGKAYALVINNFSASGAGFKLEWGGTGEFSTPDAEIVILNPKPIYCVDEEVQIYAVDRSASGAIVEYDWNFGAGASTTNIKGAGTHNVSFSNGGNKPIVLNLESDIGCIAPLDTFVVVEERMEVNETIEPITCHGYDDGIIDLSIESPSVVQSIFWQDNNVEMRRDSLPPGTYQVEVTNLTGCVVTEVYEIVDPNPIEVNEIISNASCGGGMDGSIELIASGDFPAFSYDFNDGMGFNLNNIRTGLPSGIYTVSVLDDKDCRLDTSFYLNEINFFIQNSILNEPLCFGESTGSIEWMVTGGMPNYEFDYQLDGNFTSNNVLSNIPAGGYVVLIKDQNDCQGYVDTLLTQPDSLSLEVALLDVSCFGEDDGEIDISITGGVPNYNISWNTGSAQSNIIDLSPGDYQLNIVDNNGCNLDRAFVIVEPELLQMSLIDKMDLICYGDNNGFILVDGMGGTGDYRYTLGGSSSSGPDFQDLGAGRYNLFLTDDRGCSDSLTIDLVQPEELFVNIVGDSAVNLGQKVSLQAIARPNDRMMTWQWTPAEQVDCETCPTVEAQPYNSANFTLIGTDENGCEAEDQLAFLVYPIREVGVPNVLIPTKEGPNGHVTIYAGPHVSEVLELNVFDRWGNLLFTRSAFPPNDYTLGWNGLANGQRAMPGVYVYTSKIRYLDGVTKLISGEIVLLN